MWQPRQKRANQCEVVPNRNELKIGEASDKEKIKIVYLKNLIGIQFFLANGGRQYFIKLVLQGFGPAAEAILFR